MSDARRYAVWPEPRSRSRSLKGSRPSVPHGTNFYVYFYMLRSAVADNNKHCRNILSILSVDPVCLFIFLHYTDAFVTVLISSFLKHATVRWRCRAAAASGSLWRCNRLIYRSCGDASRAARSRGCCGGWREQHLDVGLHVWPALCVQITGSWRIDAAPSTSPVTSSSSQLLQQPLHTCTTYVYVVGKLFTLR